MPDKFQATWVSYSSISDFLKCPRSYYLNNMYKDPQTRHKISIMSPPLALGQAVHEVVESLSTVPTEDRFKTPLRDKLEISWRKIAGEKGGFSSQQEESKYKDRGLGMLKKIEDHPGPVANLAVKIQMDLPHYWLSEEDNIILCGKIDWLEYLPDSDQVHIIDFKTGKNKEKEGSLQLPIYLLLTSNCQSREVDGVSYWYIDLEDELTKMKLPELKSSEEEVLKIAKKIQLSRKLNKLECPRNGCRACEPLEKVIKGEAKFVGTNDFRQDVYVMETEKDTDTSVIL